ncbi:FAD-binding oxidoreductase [Methylonatrum kenyense]|uniref:FAD-binding oxidoreductase n=1 Tax=Methylonatrum kenyense TaxID=455253 RepID=UPI0020BEB0FC|nr:FAD-binding oxidoreductase [Methylonatrum kenyense]MCK8514913.1 FAD-binding oxidoreductase [Methylonatrum kenyense]
MSSQMESREGVAALPARLAERLGAEHVLTGDEERRYFSTDLSFQPGELADCVIRPGSTEELSDAVRLCAEAGVPVVPRGGGMSYTRGYVPEQGRSVLVDMRRMNRILEINADDMYVTVECGCTWKQLYEALQEQGVRTPYYGPLSGMYATVGGALSQNSLFLGSGLYNTAAESCLGLQVVMADGRLVQTGSGAQKHSNGFYRHFGPDLTGLFTADTGAFGFKAVATLRLIPSPRATEYLSFGFESLDAMLKAQTDIARLRIASECYGFDPYYNSSFEDMGFTLGEGMKMLGKIATSGGVKGLVNSLKVAVSGRKVLSKVNYSLHMTFDGIDAAAARSGQRAAFELCEAAGGREIDHSIPVAFRAEPFNGVRTILLGAKGEIWLPVHGFFPLSRARQAAEATEQFIRDNQALMERHGIKTSYLTAFSGSEFVIEPSFYWFDRLGDFRLDLIEPEFRAKWKDIPEDLDTRQVVLRLRAELRDLFDQHGACHLQIGKYYPFRDVMASNETWELLQGVKRLVDPEGRMNPGSLGL